MVCSEYLIFRGQSFPLCNIAFFHIFLCLRGFFPPQKVLLSPKQPMDKSPPTSNGNTGLLVGEGAMHMISSVQTSLTWKLRVPSHSYPALTFPHDWKKKRCAERRAFSECDECNPREHPLVVCLHTMVDVPKGEIHRAILGSSAEQNPALALPLPLFSLPAHPGNTGLLVGEGAMHVMSSVQTSLTWKLQVPSHSYPALTFNSQRLENQKACRASSLF